LPFALEITVVQRLLISKHFGFFAEIGAAKSIIQGGIYYITK
jgi:hypothetical protein